MNKKKLSLLISILLILLLGGCISLQHRPVIQEVKTNKSGLPSTLWLSERSEVRVDTIFTLAKQAHRQLINKDTLGAELTYEYAFERISEFSDEEQITLTSWAKYDSVLKLMNTDYELIFAAQEEALEA